MGWLNIVLIPFRYPLFVVICYFVVDVDRMLTACAALSSFVPPRIQWDAVDDSIWITPAAGLEECWKLSDTFRYLFLLKSCAVNNISVPLRVWIFSTIKVNIFFQFSLLFHFRFLSRPQRSELSPGFEEKPGLSDRGEVIEKNYSKPRAAFA